MIKNNILKTHTFMKKFLSMVFALMLTSTAFAQNVLEITDISQPNDVYSSEDNKAVVVVRCHKSIPLTFESTMDKSALKSTLIG